MPATVKFSADLSIQIAASTAPCGVPADPGDARRMAFTTSWDTTYGQRPAEIDSPSSFVALSPDPVACTMLWFHVLSGDGFEVRLTHAASGTQVYPVDDYLILSVPESETIELLEVQGEGEIEWAMG